MDPVVRARLERMMADLLWLYEEEPVSLAPGNHEDISSLRFVIGVGLDDE